MQQEGQNAAEKAAFTGGGYRASLVRAAETAAPAAAAAPVSTPAQEDPGETGGDEEPSEPAQVTQHSIHDENGYYVHNGSAYNSITKDGLWVGGTDENTGFHVDSDGNVTTTGSITVNRTGGAGSVTIDASTGKITGVAKGDINENSTDAVNGSQLYNAIKGAEGTTYAARDSVVIADGSTTGEDKTISVKAGNGIEAGADGVAVKVNGNNLTVNENGVSLSENLSGLTSVTASRTVAAGNFAAGNVKINADNSGKITGLTDGDISETSSDAVTGKQLNAVKKAAEELDGLAVKYTDENKTAVDLGSATLTTTGAITGGSVTVDGVTVDNGKITGLATESITGDTDATNKKYVDDKVTTAIDELDIPEYSAGNGIDITGETISAKAKENGNIVVDENGISLATEVSGLTSVTATGAITGGSFVVNGKTYISDAGLNANSQKITNVAAGDIKADSTDAVNGGQLQQVYDAMKKIDGTTYADGDGISISGEDNKISVNAGKGLTIVDDKVQVNLKDDEKNLELLNTGELALKSELNVTSVTAGGAVMAGSFNAGNIKINASDSAGTITGLTNTEWTGTATNGRAATEDQLASVQSQIKDYTAGDGINIGDDDTISVKYGNGLGVDNGSLTVKGYEGITVDANGVSVNLASNSGLGFDRGALYIMTPRGGNIEITEDGLDLADEVSGLTSVSAGQLTATNSLTAGSIIVDGKTYISSEGLNVNGKITGVTEGDISATSTEAVNGSQLFEIKQVSDLAVTYTSAAKDRVELGKDGNNATLTHVADGALSGTSTDAVNGGQLYATNQIVGDGKWNTGSNYLTGDVEDLTDAANALDSAIGNNRYTGDNVLNANTDGKTYTSVTAAISTLDSNIGNLTMTSEQAYYSQGTKVNVIEALDKFNSLFGPMNFSEAGAHYINNDANVSSALMIFDSNLWRIDKNFDAMLQNVGFRKVGDEFTTTIDWSDSSYGEGTTIVTAIKDLDDRVLTLEGKNPAGQSLSAFSKMSTANVSALSALSNMDTATAEALASMTAEQAETLAAKAPAAAPAAPAPGDPTATSTRPGPDGESETGDTGDAYEVKQNLHVTGDTTLDGTLTVDGAGTFNDGLTVNTKTEGGTALTVNGGASINGTLNMNGNKITGVADGEISETSTDAVNGSQLWGVQQDIENNASAIASLGGQVSRLDNRIDRVGAGAAALAALHPLDYDPEVKWDFAAGHGNYRGANAVSVGAFYRPNEDVMFSVGGSMGGGENMVNAGVSFKLGSGSGLTTSRTAMARELAAMKDTVAAQNAQIEAQAKQIEELTALVEKLAAEKAGAPEEKKA